MITSGTPRVFLILGDPVAQVRAPEAFNHLFVKHGVNAVLVPAKVRPAHLATFVKASLLADPRPCCGHGMHAASRPTPASR